MPDTPAAWTREDSGAASAEGWDIFAWDGPDAGPFQLQRIDTPPGYDDPSADQPGDARPVFGSDPAAWQYVLATPAPLHTRALEFLREHSRREYDLILLQAGQEAQ
jgi:hypothetical protein